MTKHIEPGTLVISGDYTSGPYEYGGPSDAGVTTLTFHAGAAGRSIVHAPAGRVAPADVPLADAKDPRISVVQDKAGRPGTWVGPWRLDLPHVLSSTWHRTKREAVEAARVRLAIIDFHEVASADEAA